jgi:hypothetical protein
MEEYHLKSKNERSKSLSPCICKRIPRGWHPETADGSGCFVVGKWTVDEKMVRTHQKKYLGFSEVF